MAVLVRIVLIFSIFFSQNIYVYAEEGSYRSYWNEFNSPWKSDAKWIIPGGLALGVFLKQATPDFVESTQRNWTQDKPLREYSKYGDYFGQGLPNLLYVIGMGTHYYFTNNQKSAERSLFMLKTGLYSTVFTHVLKFAWQEPRPDNPNQKDSFPSGHTTAAFAFASSVAMEHGIYWGTASYFAATYAGFSRINDNKHRLNDVVAGAAIGIGYGVGIYQSMHGEENSKESALLFLPNDDLDGATVVYWRSF